MVYLLKMVIFHGELLNNPMVTFTVSGDFPWFPEGLPLWIIWIPWALRTLTRLNQVSITTPSGEVKTQECLTGADIVVQAKTAEGGQLKKLNRFHPLLLCPKGGIIPNMGDIYAIFVLIYIDLCWFPVNVDARQYWKRGRKI